jgi:hypothetical protein
LVYDQQLRSAGGLCTITRAFHEGKCRKSYKNDRFLQLVYGSLQCVIYAKMQKKSRSGVLRLFLMPGSFDFAYASLRMTKLRGALPRFFRLIRPGEP